METEADDSAALLSNSLQSLSLDVTTKVDSATAAAEADSITTNSDQQHAISHRPVSSRRSSAFGTTSSSHAKLSRKTSSTFSKSDTPTKPSSRTSSGLYSRRTSSGLEDASRLAPEIQQAVTAGSIAHDFLTKELDLHKESSPDTETVVFLHDSCYGHRYARPKVSKSTLSMIVERPERLQASARGVAAAYVRLKALHVGGREPPHPHRDPSKTFPFGIKRSNRAVSLEMPAVTAVHGSKWMQELHTMCELADSRLKSGGKELNRIEDQGATAHSAKSRLHEGDLYLCKESLEAFQGALGGVLDAVDAVFGSNNVKRSFVAIRPPGHHCSADLPSGFCWLNNVHIGIEHAAQMHGLTHAAIIDFDLHHGDGSQTITWERNVKASKAPKNAPLSRRTSIGYFSLHDINSYPCEYGDDDKVQRASLCIENAHGQSIWNVHLRPWKTLDDFWRLYEERYLVILEKARAYLKTQTQRFKSLGPSIQPKAAIFISAGFDASEWEGEGMQRHKVNVPTEFYARFTSDIAKLAQDEDSGVDGRVISVLEGGYSDRALMSGVLSHVVGLTDPTWNSETTVEGLGHSQEVIASENHIPKLPQSWWSQESLTELESLLQPKVEPAPRKSRVAEAPTYTSPTQSFTAKMVDPSKIYRSASSSEYQSATDGVFQAPPTPPQVDWATSVVELARLLIPDHRQINSCKHEELAEVRPRRQRHSSIGLPAAEPPEPKMQLRRGRGKAPPTPDANELLPPRQRSESARRKTIGDFISTSDATTTLTNDQASATDGRPSTAHSLSESIMSVGEAGSDTVTTAQVPLQKKKSPGENVHVGRTRRASGAKAEAKATVAMRKNQSGQNTSSTTGTSASTSNQHLHDAAAIPASGHRNADVDSLTQGVKSITLKMPSESKGDSSIKDKSIAKANRKTPVPRTTKSVASKTARPKSSKTTSEGLNSRDHDMKEVLPPTSTGQETSKLSSTITEQHRTPQSGSDNLSQQPISIQPALPDTKLLSNNQFNTAVLPGPTDEASNTSGLGVPLSSSIPVEATLPNATLTGEIPVSQPSTDNMSLDGSLEQAWPSSHKEEEPFDEFIPYIPDMKDGILPKQPIDRPTTLTWLPPNTNTPTQTPVKRTKDDLPVFTSSGHIPFGLSPKRIEKSGTADSQKENANSDVKMAQMYEVTTAEKNDDIWVVPVTPKQ